MISTLKLQNIKCFDSAKFKFSNLTVFCGANLQGNLQLFNLYSCSDKIIIIVLKSGKLSLVGEYFSVGHARI